MAIARSKNNRPRPDSNLRRFLLACLAALAFSSADSTAARADSYDWMFEPDNGAAEINIGLPEQSRQALNLDPNEYVAATFRIDGPGGQTFGPVPADFRLKGSASFRTLDGKAAFKLKFAKANRPWGLKKMTLNNMVQDPTKVRETLAYDVFRAMDVPASRSGYANVSINGEPYGLYLNLETLDDQSMERWFDSMNHLYEGQAGSDLTPEREAGFEVDEGDEDDTSDLEALIAVAGTDPADWLEAVSPLVDLDEMTRMWATEVYIGQWDGYLYNTNNFYLHSDENGRFSMLPSGTDQTFDWYIEFFPHDQVNDPRSILFQRCLEVDSCRAMYAAALVEVRAKVRELRIADHATERFEVIEPDLLADPRNEHTADQTGDALDRIGEFLYWQDQYVDLLGNMAPNAPTGVEATPAPGAIDVSWEPATTRGASPVSGFSVSYSRVGEDSTSTFEVEGRQARSFRIPGLRGGTAYEVSVRALSGSGAGEAAAVTGPVVAGVVDLPAPKITSAPSGLVTSDSARFQFRAEAAGSFECQLDGKGWAACASPAVHSGLSEGSHRFEVRLSDPAGNLSAATGRNWTVDTVSPRLRSARYIRQAGRWHRIRIETKLEEPALRLQLSTARRKPAVAQITTTLTRQTVTLKQGNPSQDALKQGGLNQSIRFRWARLKDQAGNTSAWKPITQP